jgi:hypothetical protein
MVAHELLQRKHQRDAAEQRNRGGKRHRDNGEAGKGDDHRSREGAGNVVPIDSREHEYHADEIGHAEHRQVLGG